MRKFRFARLYTDALSNDAAIVFYHVNGYICESYLNMEDPACLQNKSLIFTKALSNKPLVL